jgi:Concanavalin A-like lectin/glucanases superfamily/VanZ like family
VTLRPSDPEGPIELGRVLCVLCGRKALADGLANLLLFVPLGIALAALGCAPRRVILLAGGLSLSIELAQFAIPGRDPSLGDLLFNVAGAAVGVGLGRRAPRWLLPDSRRAGLLSLGAALAAASVFVSTDVLFTVSLPDTPYFAGSPSLQLSDRPLRIGANVEPRGFFRGVIDEVRVYRRARTAEEIRTDMNTPVALGPPSVDLVAAYGFDEGAGATVTDRSGHGNSGRIDGATWTPHGRFGAALVFDGVGSVVLVPPSPSLDLHDAMTLEAWIQPTVAQRGWRSIVQKDVDAYFLFSGARAGALKPGGGGTFGSSTELMASPTAVSTNAWTHVALTYDGTALEFYLDGRSAARRLRWYPGRIRETSLNGMTIPPGDTVESRAVRERLHSGVSLRIDAVAAAPVAVQVPLVYLLDPSRNEILLLAADGDDLLFRVRTRAAALELDNPALRAVGIIRGIPPGDPLPVTVSQRGARYCIEVRSRSACDLGFTLGMGWTFLLYAQVPASWPPGILSGLWVLGLVFPFGFWGRHRWESWLGALVLVLAGAFVSTMGRLGITPIEIGGALAGLLGGHVCAARIAGLGVPSSESSARRC